MKALKNITLGLIIAYSLLFMMAVDSIYETYGFTYFAIGYTIMLLLWRIGYLLYKSTK